MSIPPLPPDYVPVQEIADVLGLSIHAVNRRRQRGTWDTSGLPPLELVKGRLACQRAVFDAWVAAQAAATAQLDAAALLRDRASQLEANARAVLAS